MVVVPHTRMVIFFLYFAAIGCYHFVV